MPQQRRPGRHGAMLAFLHFLRLLVTALENFMVPLCSKPLAQSYQRGRGGRRARAMSMPSTPARRPRCQPPARQLAAFGGAASMMGRPPRMQVPAERLRGRPPASAAGRLPSPPADAAINCACGSNHCRAEQRPIPACQAGGPAAAAEQRRRASAQGCRLCQAPCLGCVSYTSPCTTCW